MAQPIPSGTVDTVPLNYPIINRDWAGILVALLYPLRDPNYWIGTEEQQNNAVDEVEALQYALMQTVPEIEDALTDEAGYILTDEAGYILEGG